MNKNRELGYSRKLKLTVCVLTCILVEAMSEENLENVDGKKRMEENRELGFGV